MTDITLPGLPVSESARLEDVIKAAWKSPEMHNWNPNTNPTCRAAVRSKADASGLILPPHMRKPSPVYFVDFVCEFGNIRGAPAYRITGKCNGAELVVAQGFMVEKPA